MRLRGERFVATGLSVMLVACVGAGGGVSAAPVPAPPQGPAADYPVTVGAPYAVSGVTYTPVDTLNYDQVGTLAIDAEGGSAISAAHHTLPVPSYVEVTSLDTGRTILARVERRGPMGSNALLALSAGAAEQLGAHAGTPVRVRRVNPPEQERAMLRAGGHAPVRMDTPMSLVEVLKRKLPGAVPAKPDPEPDAVPETILKHTAKPKPEPKPKVEAEPKPKSKPRAHAFQPRPEAPISEPKAESPARSKPEPKAPPISTASKGFVIQAGAFSSEANAQRAAKMLGGQVSKGGSFHVVRTGPFATRAEAQASLAKVKAAGYSDARIQTKD